MRVTESERDRLQHLYEALADDDLVALDPAELTDEAQGIRATELRRRRLAQAPKPLGMEAIGDRWVQPPEVEDDGLITLVRFSDGLELSRACNALNASGLAFEIKAWPSKPWDGEQTVIGIRIEPEGCLAAQAALREAMGYFPLSEVVNAPVYVDDGSRITLADFETIEEADRAANLLACAGIDYVKESSEDDDGEAPWYSIEVSAADFNRSLQLLAKELEIPTNGFTGVDTESPVSSKFDD